MIESTRGRRRRRERLVDRGSNERKSKRDEGVKGENNEGELKKGLIEKKQTPIE